MKILFFGDSITDAERNRDAANDSIKALGYGFVRVIADKLAEENPNKYTVINRGVSGNRIVDLYARIKKDVWNEKPDVINILVGVNDVWHEINSQNGVDVERFEKVYRTLLEDTKKVLPNAKIILCEPFFLKGTATENIQEKPNKYACFCEVYEYAKVVEKLAREFNFPFVFLQAKLTEQSKKYGVEPYLYDGVHPNTAGANLIANEWLKIFKNNQKANEKALYNGNNGERI